MVYDICFDIAAFLFLLFAALATFGRYNKPTLRNYRFKRLLMALLITLPIDMIGGFFITNSSMVSVGLNMFIQSVGFLGISVVVWSYVSYMECFIENPEKYKTLHGVNFGVAVVYALILLANIFLGFIFFFDENGAYTKGPLYLIVYIVPSYYFIYGVSIMLFHRRSVEKAQFYASMSLVPFIVIDCILQFFVFPQNLILLFAISLSVMVIFFFIETPDFHKLENALAEADAASRSKSDFLANMSHEIRTPMNAIVGMCELILREQNISDSVQEYCYNIQNSGRSLLSIINDILDFSKIESGKMELIEEEFNIASTLNDVINMAVARKGDKKLEIVVHVDPDIPAGLIGDEIRIRQIIINLVTNAIKYTRAGGVFIRVSHTKQDYGINLSVSVADTGIGITEEDLEKLFSSFQQVDTKKNRSVEGTGLGLAISKQLITKMGGFINVSSEYGRGSEFRFVIPLKVKDPSPFINVRNAENIRAAGYIGFGRKFADKRVSEEYRRLISELGTGLHTRIDLFNSFEELKDAVENSGVDYNYIFTAKEEYAENEEYFSGLPENMEVVLVQDRTDAIEPPKNTRCMFKPFYALSAASVFNHESIVTNIGERRGANIRFTAPGARVLIVDDNQINLKVAVGLMRPYHMQVVTADSAASAISLLRSKDFHIVFMDHMMPEVDGVEATQMIRANDEEYYKKLPIIALTANAVNGVKEMFLDAGMNDFLAKPIELNALDRVLRAWLPRELMKTPTEGVRYLSDRRKSSAPAPEAGDEIFSESTGIFYTGGDREAYLEILGMYVNKGDEKLNYIRELFGRKDWKNYVIEVHALKSSSLSVGSKLLSERAKELELAGKAGNYSLIEKKNDALLELYEKVIAIGKERLGEAIPEKKTEPEAPAELTGISADEAAVFTDRILAACESFDSDEITAICEEAEKFSLGGKPLKELFGGIKSCAAEFEYDEAAEKASALRDTLKGGV